MGVELRLAISKNKQKAELVYPGHLEVELSLLSKRVTVPLASYSLYLFYYSPTKAMLLLAGNHLSYYVEVSQLQLKLSH